MMTIFNPCRDMQAMRRQVNAVLDDLFGRREEHDDEHAWHPPVDVFETDSRVVVCADLPGLSRDEIEVQLSHDTLTISGDRRVARQPGENVHRGECPHGTFRRAIRIDVPIAPEQATATYTCGVLAVELPRTQPAKTRQVRIDTESV